jgi:putative nucleotidyltransferase with HDIG domain
LSDVVATILPEEARARCSELVSSFQDIPTIPEVLARIWQLVDDPRSSAADLEKVVSMEPPLAAKVLRLVNSPYYGGRGRIQDVKTAITHLGFHTLRNLAICLSVASSLRRPGGTVSIVNHRALWQHSVATAVLARALAREVGLEEAEEAFTAGLLHDIGKFVISLGRPEAYAEILRRSQDAEMTLEEAEASVLGFDHAILGADFAERWHFPQRLCELILRHHQSREGEVDREMLVLRLADAMSHELRSVQVLGVERLRGVEPCDLESLGLSGDWYEGSRDRLAGEIDEAQEFMNLL